MFSVGTTNEQTRVEWIERALQRIPAGLTILDAGAGEQQFKRFCGHLNYIAQDFGEYDGTGNVGLHTGSWDNTQLDIRSDITSIPLPDASVDAVMCTEVFEHLPNPVDALREFSRLVRPEGWLLITAPFFSLTHFAPYHFASGFNRYFYEHHLPREGFEIIELAVNGNFFESVAQETRRVMPLTKSHTTTKLRPWEKLFLAGTLQTLQRLSARQTDTGDLLPYGLHVLARRATHLSTLPATPATEPIDRKS